MVLLDGKKLADKILNELKQKLDDSGQSLRLAVVMVGENPVIQRFVEQKKKTAQSIGVDVRIYQFETEITTNELRRRIAEIVHEEKNSGVIIQLPLPPHINVQYILNAVTPEKDIDVLSSRSIGSFVVGKTEALPPVAGAIQAFFEEYNIDFRTKRIAILGGGNLVGRPVALWLVREKANFTLIARETDGSDKILREADIIITGIGKPKFITADMVKDGVIILDAGTSESEGRVAGDVDFDAVAQKASFITPVPGGIGPMTVALLLKNLVILSGTQ